MIGSYAKRAFKAINVLRIDTWRRALFRFGVAAAVEHVAVLRSLGNVQTVVDIGANRGQFALAVRACLPGSCVISFEPLEGPARRFRKIFASDPKVTLHRIAVGSAAESATIHVSARDDSSSLLPISLNQTSLFPGTAEVRTEVVRVEPLDMRLDRREIVGPALLKLDVQGFELAALAGCERVLDSFTWIYVECSFIELYTGQALAHEVIGWLENRGFYLAGIYNLTADDVGISVQADFLFRRSAQVAQSSSGLSIDAEDGAAESSRMAWGAGGV